LAKPQEPEEDEQQKRITQMGVYIMIPFVLAVSPIVGWIIGSWLDKKLDTAPYLMYVGLLLGFIAGFRELYRIIKRFGNGA
jgi:F0F1-type ATP synthase assembly protein I